MATLFPFPNSKAQVRTMSSTNWAEAPSGKGLASMVSKLETDAYLTLLFQSNTKLLPSVYWFPKVWSEDLLAIPLWGLSSGPRFLGINERGERPWGVARRLDTLRTFQGDIVRPEFSISTTWYMRIHWSDIHEWLLLFSCLTWRPIKSVSSLLPPGENFKASSISTAISVRFWRKEGQPRQLGLASSIIKLQSGAQVPTFELTVPSLFLPFSGRKVGNFSLGLATSRRVLKLRLVLG